jgi:GTP cyclohydrolase I
MTIHPDVQSQHDDRRITIDRVGVKNIRYPIVVENRTNITQHTIADIDIYVELASGERGTHMSRFLEILNRYHQENLISNLEDFLLEIKKELGAKAAYTKFKFPYFMEKSAPVSGIKSLLSYSCVFQASYREKYKLIIGVTVPVTTLCPCSREISEKGAHNQRSYVTVKVLFTDFIWLEELIELVEGSASCEIFSLLKRADEKYVTEKAYDNPYFVEDVVRELTLKLRADKRIEAFKVESVNQESIHDHDAYAGVWSGKRLRIKD